MSDALQASAVEHAEQARRALEESALPSAWHGSEARLLERARAHSLVAITEILMVIADRLPERGDQ